MTGPIDNRTKLLEPRPRICYWQGMQVLEPQWILRDADPGSAGGDTPPKSAPGGLSALVRRLLAQRGFRSETEIERFLHPRLRNLSDPFELPAMEGAVERILRAIDGNEMVVAYGDYDVDGVTSLTLLSKVLSAYGLKHHRTFLPHRMDEGYGLSREGLERCLEQSPVRPDLLIAVDCGTSSVEEVAWLKQHGIDVIILDHHESHAESRPACVALVNPKLGEEFHFLCSVGIVFKVAHALLKRRPLENFNLRDYLDIVAVGTVADIVPLVDENRLLVRRGLRQLEQTRNPGLAALIKASGIEKSLTSIDIGFRIGPRLNASGRLDTAQDSLDLLLTDDPSEAQRIAMRLDRRNRERQKVESRIHEEAGALIAEERGAASRPAIVLGSRNWHPGVVGIVASRLVKRHHRPTFVVAFGEDGVGKGSGRSVEGVSLVEALNACRDLLLEGGGHEMAAGLTIKEEKFLAFRERFTEYIGETVDAEILRPRLYLDAEARLQDLTLSLLDSYELLQPFGQQNHQPVFLCRGVQLLEEPRVLKEKHLKFQFKQDDARREAIYFGGAEVKLPRPPWDIAFTIDRNVFRGQVSLSIFVQAVRAAEPW